jgi:hypothetical protein
MKRSPITVPRPVAPPPQSHPREWKAYGEALAARAAEIIAGGERPIAFADKSAPGRTLLIAPSARAPGKWQITFLDADGTPTGHAEAATFALALAEARMCSADLWAPVSGFEGFNGDDARTYTLRIINGALRSGKEIPGLTLEAATDRADREAARSRGFMRYEVVQDQKPYKVVHTARGSENTPGGAGYGGIPEHGGFVAGSTK